MATHRGRFRGLPRDSGACLGHAPGPFWGPSSGLGGMHRGDVRDSGACLGHAPGPFWGPSSGLGGIPWPRTAAVLGASLGTRGHALGRHRGRFGGLPRDSGACTGAMGRTRGHASGMHRDLFGGHPWGSGAYLGHAPGPFWGPSSGLGGMPWPWAGAVSARCAGLGGLPWACAGAVLGGAPRGPRRRLATYPRRDLEYFFSPGLRLAHDFLGYFTRAMGSL